MRLLLLSVLLAASASAQDAPAQPDPEAGRIAGVVTWDETGEPLIGANVFLVGTTRGAATDIDGRFVIEDVPVGMYVARVSYVGFLSQEIQVTVGHTQVTRIRAELEAQAFDCEPWVHCYDPVAHPRSAYAARRVVYDSRGTDRCYPSEGMTEAVAR